MYRYNRQTARKNRHKPSCQVANNIIIAIYDTIARNRWWNCGLVAVWLLQDPHASAAPCCCS